MENVIVEILNGKMRKVKKIEFEICEKFIWNFRSCAKRTLDFTYKESDKERRRHRDRVVCLQVVRKTL